MTETVLAYRAQITRSASGGHLRLVAEPRAGSAATSVADPPGPAGDPSGAGQVAPSGVDAGEALAALAAAADLLARADLTGLDDRELLEHTVAVDRQVTRVEAARAAALEVVDRRQAYAEDACVTTASWLRLRTRRDFGAATRAAVTARRLDGLPLTRAALADGTISLTHAEVIAQAATPARREAIADHEATLVELAGKALPRDVRRACARIAEVVDPDGADAPPPPAAGGDRSRQLRELFLSRLGDHWDLRARLDQATGDRLWRLLQTMDRPDPADTPEAERLAPAQRRHDAFDRILRAAEEHPDLPRAHGARPHALVTIDLLALLGGHDPTARPGKMASGGELDLAQALALLDDAAFTPILMWGPWRAIGVGRRHRTLPAWLRPLLAMVHGHCRGPGCDRPIAWTDAAHLTPWASGGHTDLNETIPACPGHHKLMDQVGWNVTLDPDTAICTWTSPDGRTTWRTHPPEP